MTDRRLAGQASEVLVAPTSNTKYATAMETEVLVAPSDRTRYMAAMVVEVLIPVPPNPVGGPPLSVQSIGGSPIYIKKPDGTWVVERSMNDPYV